MLFRSVQQANAKPKDDTAEKPVTQKALGLDLAALSKDLRTKYKIKDSVKGVVVTGVDNASDAAEKRLSAGDVIVETSPDPWWAEVGYYAARKAITGLAGLPPGHPRPPEGGDTEQQDDHADAHRDPRIGPGPLDGERDDEVGGRCSNGDALRR